MQIEIISMILGLMVVGFSLYVAFTFMGSHIDNGLCENKFTSALDQYTDYYEGVSYPLWLTDCCYDESRAKDVCERYKAALERKGEQVDAMMCDDSNLGKDNPATLFSCVESTKLCNNETCVQSCDKDGLCKRESGEGYWCVDCQ
jgi:hypothetical protein